MVFKDIHNWMNVFLTWQNFRMCSSQAAVAVLSLTEVMRNTSSKTWRKLWLNFLSFYWTGSFFWPTKLLILGFGMLEKVHFMPEIWSFEKGCSKSVKVCWWVPLAQLPRWQSHKFGPKLWTIPFGPKLWHFLQIFTPLCIFLVFTVFTSIMNFFFGYFLPYWMTCHEKLILKYWPAVEENKNLNVLTPHLASET